MEAQIFLGFLSKLGSESGKAVADAVFISSNHGHVTQSSVIYALIYVQPHRTLVERMESAHFLKMLSDETSCGWRVGRNVIGLSSFIIKFVWRVSQPSNWTRDYILQEIVGELD